MQSMPVAQILFLISCLAIPTTVVNSQSPEFYLEENLSPEQLKEDFELLRNKIELSQPGLYLYTSKDSLDKIFDTIMESLTVPMTSIDFYRKISILNKHIRNFHTRTWPSENFEERLITVHPRFPFDIYWENKSMIIIQNNSLNEEIQFGTIIKSINGVPAEDIFQELVDTGFRDGFNASYPQTAAIKNFSHYYGRHIGTPTSFMMELITPDGISQEVDIQALKFSDIKKNRLDRYKGNYSRYTEDWDSWIDEKKPALVLEIKEDISVMTIRTFYHPIIEENGQRNFQKFFNSSFDQIIDSNVKHLIIDVRDNMGGSDAIAMELISHLYDKSFLYYKRRTSIVEPNMKYKKEGDLYEILGQGVWRGKVTPSKRVFIGMVYVLMNGYSISATGEFIGHLKNINRAIFIGEEAGGNPVIFTGGQTLNITLTHSKIRAEIPMHLNEMNVRMKNTGHGVIPDHVIIPSTTDILESKDPIMEFALKLIDK